MKNKIGFIGAGNMGGAIISGLLKGQSTASGQLFVSDPRKAVLDALADDFPGIHTDTDNASAARADILVLAVKPQIYQPLIESIRDLVSRDTVIVTIAAGLTIGTVQKWFGGSRKIVRTMPNTPALCGEGMTALCRGPEISEDQFDSVRKLFHAVGKTVEMPEKLMDAYTALAGSSPAWVFMFIEALADGAVLEGIPRKDAYEIAAQAVMGSAKLAGESGLHPGVLKDQVCSPGGTTIEAVATLEKAGFRSAVIQAVSDCTAKAEKLGGK